MRRWRRTLIELLHVAAGVAATAAIARLASWSVPYAHGSIRAVAWAMAAAVIVLGLKPLRRAWAEDRARHATHHPMRPSDG